MNFRSIEMPIQGLVTVKKLFKAKLPSHRRGDGMGWDGMGWDGVESPSESLPRSRWDQVLNKTSLYFFRNGSALAEPDVVPETLV